MQMQIKETGGIFIMTLAGSIRAEDNAAFEDATKDERIMSAPGVVIDVAKLEYINSRAIGAIMSLWKELSTEGRKIFVVRPAPLVERLLRSVGLFNFVLVKNTVEEALKDIPKGS